MAEESNETSSLSVDCPFSKLPDHLLIEILVLVPIVDWGQLSCVSKRWANLFREDNLWHAALIRCFPLAGEGKRWPGPIPRGVSKRRFAALCLSKCIAPADDELSEIVGHTYLFLKEQLEIATNPPLSIILHGTMIDQFVIACGESRDRAAELASLIWLSVIENLEENHQTFLVLKRLSLEADVFLPRSMKMKVEWKIFERLFTDFRDCLHDSDYYDWLSLARQKFEPIPASWLGY